MGGKPHKTKKKGDSVSTAVRHSEKYYGTHPSFKTRLRHRKLGYFLHRNRKRPEGLRPEPECLVMEPAPGTAVSDKPPVRIFLGTEAKQFRAERMFIRSIAQARDPSRRYEVYLMNDLAGFDRRGWKTGFTNYRYAIPALAGNRGRAIYNDVDQIYLGDPGELFDRDMKGKGVLGINERETSVMLIDCERMADVWRLEYAQEGRKHKFFRSQMHDRDLWGPMPGVWNARDWEYQEGDSKLLHYTTLQTQPWRPFPKELRYHDSPEGRIWFDMETAADQAGYTVFDEARPSRRFAAALEAWRTSRENVPVAEFGDYVKVTHPSSTCASCLDFGAAGLSEPGRVAAFDFADPASPAKNAYEIVILADLASRMPCEDVPWLLDKAFAASSGDVVVFATHEGEATVSADAMAQDPDWWRGQMQAAAQRAPDRRWMLVLVKAGAALSSARVIRS
jgi:hypothetical protein